MDRYIRGPTLGTGTFGVVFKATDKETGRPVAVKKIEIKDPKKGLDMTGLREIKLLKELHHPNIIELLDVFPIGKKNIALVFEYCDADLESIIKDPMIMLGPADVKAYMQQLLKALAACHEHWVVHRDIKPNNCLLAPSGDMKLGDFGLARVFASPGHRQYTNQVFATWYRPPELFYGSTCYNLSIDIWAAGCIFAELLLRRPLFAGENDIEILGKIFQLLGTPSKENWPDVETLPHYIQFAPVPAPSSLKATGLFPRASDDALDLLEKMLKLNPNQRWSAAALLKHRYFTNDPQPTLSAKLPKPVKREDAPLQQAAGHVLQIARPAGAPSAAAVAAGTGSAGRRTPVAGIASPGSCSQDESAATAGDQPHAKRPRQVVA